MQAVQALPASFGSSLRPVSTSNGAGSRAAGSRGPWSSAELATRPVRKGPPKPKENAPDSRKTRTSNHRIPGEGKGFSDITCSACRWAWTQVGGFHIHAECTNCIVLSHLVYYRTTSWTVKERTDSRDDQVHRIIRKIIIRA